jgi:hypothetical protein
MENLDSQIDKVGVYIKSMTVTKSIILFFVSALFYFWSRFSEQSKGYWKSTSIFVTGKMLANDIIGIAVLSFVAGIFTLYSGYIGKVIYFDESKINLFPNSKKKFVEIRWEEIENIVFTAFRPFGNNLVIKTKERRFRLNVQSSKVKKLLEEWQEQSQI